MQESAFNVAVGGWIPCGICFALISPFLAKEEDALQVTSSMLCCDNGVWTEVQWILCMVDLHQSGPCVICVSPIDSLSR